MKPRSFWMILLKVFVFCSVIMGAVFVLMILFGRESYQNRVTISIIYSAAVIVMSIALALLLRSQTTVIGFQNRALFLAQIKTVLQILGYKQLEQGEGCFVCGNSNIFRNWMAGGLQFRLLEDSAEITGPFQTLTMLKRGFQTEVKSVQPEPAKTNGEQARIFKLKPKSFWKTFFVTFGVITLLMVVFFVIVDIANGSLFHGGYISFLFGLACAVIGGLFYGLLIAFMSKTKTYTFSFQDRELFLSELRIALAALYYVPLMQNESRYIYKHRTRLSTWLMGHIFVYVEGDKVKIIAQEIYARMLKRGFGSEQTDGQ